MQAGSLVRFESYTPEVERRGLVCGDSVGLIRLKLKAREDYIGHDRVYLEGVPNCHRAQLLDHVEEVGGCCEYVGRVLGLSEEEVYIAGMQGYLHDYGKTEWLGHRYDGPLPECEVPGRLGHAYLSRRKLLEKADELELSLEELITVHRIGIGLAFHHNPEKLAKIAIGIKAQRELKLTTILHFVDIYVAFREERGSSHPARNHESGLELVREKTQDERYGYASKKEIRRLVDAIASLGD